MDAKNMEDLRQRAEQLAQEQQRRLDAACSADSNRALYELQVHQIELELQNEELRASQRTLVQATHRYQQLFDNAPVAYLLLDAQGVIRQTNQKALILLGAQQMAPVGKPLVVFLAADSHAVFFSLLQQCLRHPGGEAGEARLTLKLSPEQTLLVDATARTIQEEGGPTCLLGLVDVTSRLAAEERLALSERQFRSMVENAGLPMVLLDAMGRHLQVNPAFTAMTGFEAEQLKGTGMPSPYWPRDQAPNMALLFTQLLASGRLTRESELQHRDGRRIPVLMTASAVEGQPGVSPTYIVIHQDIAPLKEAQAQLTKAKEAAEAANVAKSAFLATMSHEIRTPFNGIMGMLQLALATKLDPEQRDYMETALGSARSLLAILNDLLDISRIEAGVVCLREVDVDPVALGQSVLDLFAQEAASKGLATRLVQGAGIPQRILADEGRLRQVLVNVVGNAVKFTDQGSVTLALTSEPGAPPRLVFAVADTGPGIDTERLEYLFQPFTQGDAAFTRRHQGSGLGLGIVRGLMQAMEGTISVRSTLGKGATFLLSLPLKSSGANVCPAPVPEQCDIQPGGGPLKVLVAEDNPVNLLFIEMALKKLGHEPTLAGNGQQALEALAGESFHCVLMDVEMPDMDGLEATRRIRAMEAATGKSRLPIVAISAHAMVGNRERFLEAGMDEYLPKPVELEALQAMLRKVCGMAEHAAAAG